jgi:hypothetical protein
VKNANLFLFLLPIEGGKAIILYATDNSASSDVHALELSPAEVQEVIAKYSKATHLKFDSGYFTHLEGKETVFKHSSDTEVLTCDCKVKKIPTTPKPTTKPTTPKPTTPKPTPKVSVKVLTDPPSTPAPTYLPPAPTTPPPTYLPPKVTKVEKLKTPPPPPPPTPKFSKKEEAVTPRTSTNGPSYLPIVTKSTTPGPKYTYIPRTYTYGALPTYTYNFNWTYAPGTYTPNTRTYTYQPTTTTKRYQGRNVAPGIQY